MIARAVGLVLAAALLAGCVRVSVVGVHCKKTELGFNMWNLYTEIECRPPSTETFIEPDRPALQWPYRDPSEASEASPPIP